MAVSSAFAKTGLMRRITFYGNTVWYGLQGEEHHHFYLEEKDLLLDIPPG